MSVNYLDAMHDLDTAILALSKLINDQDMTRLERESYKNIRSQLNTLTDHLFEKIGKADKVTP